MAVALEEIPAGGKLLVGDQEIVALETIKRGHKIALEDMSAGKDVFKFGFPIGVTREDVRRGQWLHAHNIKTKLDGVLDYQYEPEFSDGGACAPETFMGYSRENGDVGIRNEIWIVPSVGCVNKSAEKIVRQACAFYDMEGVDGIYTFPHPYGCSQLGDDHDTTQKTLAALANHPNAAAVLVLGLGCENNTPASFRQAIGVQPEGRVGYLVSQEVEDEIDAGVDMLGELIAYAKKFKREPFPVSKLRVGLKCGGSDGFSGITANPLVGAFSDMLIARGGISALTEVPEMFGAETILMNRCESREVFDKCVKMINGFKEYFLKYNQPVYENPSPGNKEGGISTLEEKSLGCTQKGGTGKVVEVLDIGDRLVKPGLNLVNGPGNDIVAVTTLAAAGAHVILFTTGRGTPLGSPVPTLKIATNTQLADKKKRWIDFNAGKILEGTPMESAAAELFELVRAIASGEKSAMNEVNDYREIAIFKDGVTL